MNIADVKNQNPAAYKDLRHFEKTTKEAFQFLITDYGFKQLEPRVGGPDCLIKYLNKTTAVRITWEWQYYIIVELGRLEVTSEGVEIAEAHDLEHLLTIRCPEKGVKQKKHPDYDEIKRVLDTYAVLLREYAEDVLTGDFSIFPQLMALSLQSIERKKAMLGGFPKTDKTD